MDKQKQENLKRALKERTKLRDKMGVPLMTPNEFELSKQMFILQERMRELESNKTLMSYLYWNFRYGKHTEFRIAVKEDGTAYIHPLNKDGDTLDFSIKDIE